MTLIPILYMFEKYVHTGSLLHKIRKETNETHLPATGSLDADSGLGIADAALGVGIPLLCGVSSGGLMRLEQNPFCRWEGFTLDTGLNADGFRKPLNCFLLVGGVAGGDDR